MKINIKENLHIGCIWLFIICAFFFILYSTTKLKEKESKEQDKLSNAQIERVWHVVDSVNRAELMQNPYYASLYEENQELKEKIQKIKEYTEDIENGLLYFEHKGFDVSELQDAIDNISFECE